MFLTPAMNAVFTLCEFLSTPCSWYLCSALISARTRYFLFFGDDSMTMPLASSLCFLSLPGLCSSFQPVPSGLLNITSNTPNSLASVVCASGYALYGGNGGARCMLDGSWNLSSAGTCTRQSKPTYIWLLHHDNLLCLWNPSFLRCTCFGTVENS